MRSRVKVELASLLFVFVGYLLRNRFKEPRWSNRVFSLCRLAQGRFGRIRLLHLILSSPYLTFHTNAVVFCAISLIGIGSSRLEALPLALHRLLLVSPQPRICLLVQLLGWLLHGDASAGEGARRGNTASHRSALHTCIDTRDRFTVYFHQLLGHITIA